MLHVKFRLDVQVKLTFNSADLKKAFCFILIFSGGKRTVSLPLQRAPLFPPGSGAVRCVEFLHRAGRQRHKLRSHHFFLSSPKQPSSFVLAAVGLTVWSVSLGPPDSLKVAPAVTAERESSAAQRLLASVTSERAAISARAEIPLHPVSLPLSLLPCLEVREDPSTFR